MTAELLPSHHEEDTTNTRMLQPVEVSRVLAERALKPMIPPILEWGPTHLQPEEMQPETKIDSDDFTD